MQVCQPIRINLYEVVLTHTGLLVLDRYWYTPSGLNLKNIKYTICSASKIPHITMNGIDISVNLDIFFIYFYQIYSNLNILHSLFHM